MGRNVSVKERCVLRVCVRVRYSTVAIFPSPHVAVCGFGRHNVANIYINNVVVKVKDAHGHDWGAFHKQTSCDRSYFMFYFFLFKTITTPQGANQTSKKHTFIIMS